MFYKNALYIVSWIVPNIFLCCTTSLLIVLFARQELSKIFLSIFIIFNFVFHTPITSFFFKDMKFLNNHEKFYRFFKSHNCNKKQFFDNIIDEEKYELFISKLNNNIDIEYLGFNGKVIKKISLNDLKKICFRKGNFIQFNLDRFLFIEPKYLKVNDIEINMDELSFLRLYLIKKFN